MKRVMKRGIPKNQMSCLSRHSLFFLPVIALVAVMLLFPNPFGYLPILQGNETTLAFYSSRHAIVSINTTQGKVSFSTELAESLEELKAGMMYRPSFQEGRGMLFVFPVPIQTSFWMKNVKTPLDMLFISPNRSIIKIHHNIPSCLEESCPTYASNESVLYVLELNGGTAIKKHIKEGDSIHIIRENG